MNARRSCGALLIALLAAPTIELSASEPPSRIQGVGEVLDGDTLDVHRADGGAARVRLHAIDGPELNQTCKTARGRSWRCGAVARDRLEQLAGGRAVDCAVRGRDGYGRLIALCGVKGGSRDLAAQLVEEGHAWAFLRYGEDYAPQERRARSRGVGVWQGPAQPPWAYRAERWRVAVQVAPVVGCPIKGNISRSGEHIYHTPWSPWYDSTAISEEQGERWFCDEAEALAAGWREARFR
jgi:endonuclease YncB( thermonuclease family)